MEEYLEYNNVYKDIKEIIIIIIIFHLFLLVGG